MMLLDLNPFLAPGIRENGMRKFTTGSASGAGGSGMRWASFALAGIAATAIIVAVVITVLSLTGNGTLKALVSAASVHPHESTARWVGDDAAMYASLNLRPGLSELLRARDFFENIVDFDEAQAEIDDGIDMLSEELGIDVRDGVLPVLGPELAIAYYNIPNADTFYDSLEEPEVIAFVGFMDMDVGRSIIHAFTARAQEEGEFVGNLTVGGHSVTRIGNDAYITVHEFEPYILIASTEEALERTLSMMAAPVSPLSDDSEFREAMERLPDDRMVSFYMDTDAIVGGLFGYSGLQQGLYPFGGGTGEGFPEPPVVAGGLTVGSKDLRMDWVVSTDPETVAGITVPSDSLELIPEELIGFFNVGGLRSAVDQFNEAMREADAETEVRDGFRDVTGLDLQADLLDPLGDEFAAVLLNLRSADEDMGEFDDFPRFAAAILVELRDQPRMEATMARVREIAAESGMEFSLTDVGGDPAWVGRVPDDSMPLELAYMFKDGFFVGGISVESLEQVQMAAEGDIGSVVDNEAYRRVRRELGEDAVFTIFVESEPLAEAVRTFISPEDMAEFEEDVMPWFDKFESFTMSAKVDEGWTVMTGYLAVN